MTARWKTITMINAEELVREKNTMSSDSGGKKNDTAEGPNGVTPTVNRHTPQQTQLNRTFL